MRKLPMMIRSTYPEGLYHRDDLHLPLQQTDAEISRLLPGRHHPAAAIEKCDPSGGRASRPGVFSLSMREKRHTLAGKPR